MRERIDVAGAVVLGPAPLFMLRRKARSQIVIKASEREPAIDAVRDAVDYLIAARSHRDVAISVDVDPQ